MGAGTLEERISEREVAEQICGILSEKLPDYRVMTGQNLLYRITIDTEGKVSHGGGAPSRGQHAFQTDILISNGAGLPLVVIELKSGRFSSHDMLTYSAKAVRHKQIYRFLRYGFVAFGLSMLGRRFLVHGDGFDFAAAIPDLESVDPTLLDMVRRQILSAERLVDLEAQRRLNLHRFEQIVEVG